jgi:hypothetical protein
MFKDFYNKAFASSRLQIHSGLDMSLYPMENQLNLFLIPLILKDGNIHESKSYKNNNFFF